MSCQIFYSYCFFTIILPMIDALRGHAHWSFGFGECPLQILPRLHEMMCFIQVSLQFSLKKSSNVLSPSLFHEGFQFHSSCLLCQHSKLLICFYLKLRPPEGYVMQTFADASVSIALSNDRLLIAIAHKADGLVSDAFGVVP